jgi:diguanylate cyclase (GGDEF)-like protein
MQQRFRTRRGSVQGWCLALLLSLGFWWCPPAEGQGSPVLRSTRQAHALSLSFQPGRELPITRTCSLTVTPDRIPERLRILPRSPADLVALQRFSWWTTRHALILSGTPAVVFLMVVVWNVVLRRRVHAQTQVIREQLEEAHTLRLQAEAATREKSRSLANILTLQRELLITQDELRHQATHDALTGLWNHGALLDLLRIEKERTARKHTSMGVLLLDVDDFKLVNDTHGHLAGDAVLAEIGHRIRGATRTYDMAGRYGGDEFLILLPDCNREQTLNSAERIRAGISEVPIPTAASTISMKVSIGATVVCGEVCEKTAILGRADQALYQAKNEGRNRTVLLTSSQGEALFETFSEIL